MPRVLLSWSSGKDSAWSLYRLLQEPPVEVVGLLTTVNAAHDRVAMHAVRRDLLQRQAEATGLPLWTVELPYPCSNEQYESLMAVQVVRARDEGVDAIAFGDLFLTDVRAYRERQMAGSGIELRFPLWLPGAADEARADAAPEATRYRQCSLALALEMQAAGLRAWITCVDPRALDASFAGREWDAAFLRDLPPHVDPCGENGEFHSFVFAGPMLRRPVAAQPGEVVERDGFVFADLLPA
jgi:uncharacterized protein (TIGR00290 family)